MYFKENTLDEVKQSIILIAKMLHQKNMLAACDGNISYRFENQVLITESGIAKFTLAKNNFAIVSLDGTIISGHPSSEMLMHLAIYRVAKNAKAVIHAHPVNTIALSIAKPEWQLLPNDCISELIIAAGNIPIVPYQLPGSQELASNIANFACEHKLMIMAKHGALVWGDSLLEAYIGMERLEHSCEILLKALCIGQLDKLSKSQVSELFKIRQTLGNKTI